MENKQATSAHSIIQKWVAVYSDDLYRWALHKTSDKETVQDLVQETFLAAFKSLDKFQGKSQPKTWLFSIMNNKIMDYHRKRFKSATINQSQLNGKSESGDVLENFFDSEGTWKPDARPNERQETEGHLLDNHEFKSVLSDCMKNLPHNWDSAIQFKYLEEKDAKEICQELGITASNYWQILHRAKLQLRMCLEKNWFKS
ncbi:MAG: sigma-70 family RNA polymerase sigma factor [Nitrospina sp.]|jgi:RNA polymerase sigma-70 factor (ECF subfamily)|nr:sigma-70 family RNA polymerase sigma factor [Nitrospina sp.]MBT6438323.1 sigma-70 family RNA polymerase sigma factor [Flavobacteriales bacterium]